MAANKWMKELKKYDDAVNYDYDSFDAKNCLFTPSPYFNWTFANKANGVPKNASVLFFSEPKAGKSLSIYAMIMEMQQRDPEGIAIYFNTELRGQLQHGVFAGLDRDRMIIYDTNDPLEIFDRIEDDIKPLVQDGMPLRIMAIDSLTNIQGIKRANADSVGQHLMGDRALTIQTGLSKVIPFCKRNGILLLATEQVRSNMDAGSYGPKEKMAASWATKHSFEYFMSLKRAGAAEDKQDIEGKTFEEEDGKDARGNKLLMGHKVYVKCEASSVGTAGRSGVFTLSYTDGIINQHEEIFHLAKNTGVLTTENNRTFEFAGKSYNGKKQAAQAIKDDPELAKALVEAVVAKDAGR